MPSTQLSQTSSTVMSDVSGIVEEAMPSIVSITNMSVQEVQSFFGQTQQQESESLGSGIIIQQSDTELLIATNNHVVEGADTLTVTFADNESVEAALKGTDPSKDLAIVAVPLSDIKDSTMDAIAIATLGDSNEVKVGEPTIAIGNALGYGQSVTTGIVSATNRQIDMDGFDSELIQTDAAINPGNSGGALLNANGAVIGINTAKISSSVAEGMGYAIPISDASEVLTNLMNRETRTKLDESEKGYLGIMGQDVSSDIGRPTTCRPGVYISEVTKGDRRGEGRAYQRQHHHRAGGCDHRQHGDSAGPALLLWHRRERGADGTGAGGRRRVRGADLHGDPRTQSGLEGRHCVKKIQEYGRKASILLFCAGKMWYNPFI